jgi:hypothetical protein
MRTRVALIAAVILAGCATGGQELVVPVDAAAIAGPASGARATKLEIADIRQVIRMERTSIGAVSMGRIVLQPQETELVRAVVGSRLDAALARHGGAAPESVYCGMRVFDVITPATALFWDVTAKVELVLRVRASERALSGSATERTYAWPSEEIIARATAGALRQVAAELDKAFAELLAGPR